VLLQRQPKTLLGAQWKKQRCHNSVDNYIDQHGAIHDLLPSWKTIMNSFARSVTATRTTSTDPRRSVIHGAGADAAFASSEGGVDSSEGEVAESAEAASAFDFALSPSMPSVKGLPVALTNCL